MQRGGRLGRHAGLVQPLAGQIEPPRPASSATSRRMLVSCRARPRCQATWSASADASPNARTESRPDRRGDAVAVEVERGEVGRDDRGRGVHLHAVDHREEVLAPQAVALHRLQQHARDRIAGPARRTAPRPGRRHAPSPASLSRDRRGLVRHVVDQAAERVDRVHGRPAVAGSTFMPR